MRINGTLSVDGTITGTSTTQSPGDNSTKLATTAYADAAGGGGSSPHALLDGVQNNDTVAQTPSRGSLIYGNSTPKWDELVIGGASTLLKSDGTDVSWGTVNLLSAFHADTLAASVARGDLIVGNSTPKWSRFVVGAANSVLTSNGTDPSWSVTPTVSTVFLNAQIRPVQLTTNTDDYNPANLHTSFEVSILSNAAVNLTGLNAGVQGEVHVLKNEGTTNTITLKHDVTSTAANRFWNPNQADFPLYPRSSVFITYDASNARWCVIGGSQTTSGTGTVTTTGSPSSGNLTKFSGATSITNGDLSGDVTTSGTLVATIANSAVTLAKIANAAASSKLLGSGASGSGAPYAELTLGTGLSMTGTTLNVSAGGSEWDATVTKASTDTVTNSAVLANDSELVTSALVSGGVYLVEFLIIYSGTSAAADMKFLFTVPINAGAAMIGYYNFLSSSDSATLQTSLGASGGTWPTGTAIAAGCDAASGKRTIHGYCWITPTSSAAIQFQFAQQIQTGSNSVSTYAGSYIRYRRVN